MFEEASAVREQAIIAGVQDFLTSATTLFEMKTALGRIKPSPKTSMTLDDASLARVQQLGAKGMHAVAGLPWNVTSGAFLGMRKHLFSPASRTESLYVDAFKEGCGKFVEPLLDWANHEAGTHKAGSALHKATLHAGFGFGFGFQVWCGCNMLLSSGAGFGQGFSIYPNHDMDGGFGGGGGLEAYETQESNDTAFHVGGGGGGDLTTCNTDEDADPISPLGIIFSIFVYLKPKRIFNISFLLRFKGSIGSDHPEVCSKHGQAEEGPGSATCQRMPQGSPQPCGQWRRIEQLRLKLEDERPCAVCGRVSDHLRVCARAHQRQEVCRNHLEEQRRLGEGEQHQPERSDRV